MNEQLEQLRQQSLAIQAQLNELKKCEQHPVKVWQMKDGTWVKDNPEAIANPLNDNWFIRATDDDLRANGIQGTFACKHHLKVWQGFLKDDPLWNALQGKIEKIKSMT